MAEAVKGGVEKSGGKATIYQCVQTSASHTFPRTHLLTIHSFVYRVPETLSQDVLDKLHAPPKPAYPIITPEDLVKFDAFLLGIPTRFGNYPYQWKVRLFISSGGACSLN